MLSIISVGLVFEPFIPTGGGGGAGQTPAPTPWPAVDGGPEIRATGKVGKYPYWKYARPPMAGRHIVGLVSPYKPPSAMPSAITHPNAILSPAQEHIVHTVETTLRITFGIVPIVAGLDKFTNFLANWELYLNPTVARLLPMTAVTFMHIVGVIEIIAGVIVLAKPRVGGFIVMAWLIAIALQLLVGWMYVDVAVRDLVMAISALGLARLAGVVEPTGSLPR
jgi:hypothetical protein